MDVCLVCVSAIIAALSGSAAVYTITIVTFSCMYDVVWIWLWSIKCVFTWQDIFRLSFTLVYICICVCLCVSIPEFIFNMHFFRYTPSCLQLADFPPPHHFCVGICVSVHMELRLRSINVAWGDLWSATGERNAPPHTQPTCCLAVWSMSSALAWLVLFSCF